MQVTLINTRETLDVMRKLPDGTLEEAGSYEVSIAAPGFVGRAAALVERLQAADGKLARESYEDTAAECAELIRLALPRPEDVDELLGERPDMFNAMLLLTAIMNIASELDPDSQMTEQIDRLVPSAETVAAEIAAADA